jgi:hypothetical protein
MFHHVAGLPDEVRNFLLHFCF